MLHSQVVSGKLRDLCSMVLAQIFLQLPKFSLDSQEIIKIHKADKEFKGFIKTFKG